MPELPEARRKRMIAEYDLTEQDAHTLTATRDFADRFEVVARTARSPRRVANLLRDRGRRLKVRTAYQMGLGVVEGNRVELDPSPGVGDDRVRQPVELVVPPVHAHLVVPPDAGEFPP